MCFFQNSRLPTWFYTWETTHGFIRCHSGQAPTDPGLRIDEAAVAVATTSPRVSITDLGTGPAPGAKMFRETSIFVEVFHEPDTHSNVNNIYFEHLFLKQIQ